MTLTELDEAAAVLIRHAIHALRLCVLCYSSAIEKKLRDVGITSDSSLYTFQKGSRIIKCSARALIETCCESLREANDAKIRSKFGGMLDEVTQLLEQCYQVEKDFEYRINKKYFH